ncbi:unnamed protein product [Effrenium voratum]|nr:unnamed protein product [Effrenium voratum]
MRVDAAEFVPRVPESARPQLSADTPAFVPKAHAAEPWVSKPEWDAEYTIFDEESFLTPEVLGSTPSSSRGDRLEDEPTLSSSMSQASGGGSQEKSGPVAGALSTKKRQLYWTISDLDCPCPSRA